MKVECKERIKHILSERKQRKKGNSGLVKLRCKKNINKEQKWKGMNGNGNRGKRWN